MFLDIQLSIHKCTAPLWRLNSLLLADKTFCDFISNSIDEYLSFNQNEDTSYSLLWESLKAFLRGQIISYSSYSNKKHKTRLSELLVAIGNLDQECASDPSPELFKKRLDLQTEFDLISSKSAEQMLLLTRGTFYEHSDKANRLLAHQLKRQSTSRLIPQIKNSSGILVTDPKEISASFKLFYSTLYKSEFPTNTTKMNQFLDNLENPTIDCDRVKELDAPLSLEELLLSIKAMQSNKAPGPDGFTVEFLKKFSDKLAPLLLQMYNESLEKRFTTSHTYSSINISSLKA